nr:MAG TPA_asm: hypothetical protein [Bacteriophage sp.]
MWVDFIDSTDILPLPTRNALNKKHPSTSQCRDEACPSLVL